MKPTFAISLFLLLLCFDGTAQNEETLHNRNQTFCTDDNSEIRHRDRKINFFIVSKRKKGKLDPATRYNVFRARLNSIFHRKHFRMIVAADINEMSNKVKFRLSIQGANLGTLWFDSHGVYKKGYSLFTIGNTEVSTASLQMPEQVLPLSALAQFTTPETKIVIGSCYGGATFKRGLLYSKDSVRMNGDSLMIQLGNIFSKGTVYASESWVMTRPGLFNNKKHALAGYPKRKPFKDILYKPVWESIGKWNAYYICSGQMGTSHTITVDSYGNLYHLGRSYADDEKIKKRIEKNMQKLKPDLLKS